MLLEARVLLPPFLGTFTICGKKAGNAVGWPMYHRDGTGQTYLRRRRQQQQHHQQQRQRWWYGCCCWHWHSLACIVCLCFSPFVFLLHLVASQPAFPLLLLCFRRFAVFVVAVAVPERERMSNKQQQANGRHPPLLPAAVTHPLQPICFVFPFSFFAIVLFLPRSVFLSSRKKNPSNRGSGIFRGIFPFAHPSHFLVAMWWHFWPLNTLPLCLPPTHFTHIFFNWQNIFQQVTNNQN